MSVATPEAELTGRCSCGAVRYVLTELPRDVLVCHCGDCRRAAGAHSVAWLIQPLRSVEFRGGTPASRESSPDITRVFCRGCGTQLCYRDAGADHVRVTLATLDDPARFTPSRADLENHEPS